MKHPSFVVVITAALFAATPIYAQDPQTRSEELRQEREEKSKNLTPPKPSGLERALLDLENGRFTERILNPPEGIYPRVGHITAGSGFSMGPGYRHANLFGTGGVFSAFGAASFTKYWMFDARVQYPELAGGRAGIEGHWQRYDFPEEDFFGLGPDSVRANFATYGIRNTVVGVTGAYHPTRLITVDATVDHLSPDVYPGSDPGGILQVFGPAEAPGVLIQPDFFKYDVGVNFNNRQPSGNPRSGGRYAIAFQRFDDVETNVFSFNRIEIDLQQYVPLVRDRRVLALHGLVSMSEADEGAVVPFYFQRTLGGPDDLRGFRRFRFRDENILLLQAEYRWEIFTAVDGALFYDAGKVAARRQDLSFRDLETNYGIGFRFGTIRGIFLRIEGAFGSSDGRHFILRFSNVF